MISFQQRFYTSCKANYITVIAFENSFFTLMLYSDYINRSYSLCFGTQEIEIFDNLFLIGDGDIQTTEIRICVYNFRKLLDRGNLEILIKGIHSLVLKLLVKVIDGERVSQGVTYQSVFVHKV